MQLATSVERLGAGELLVNCIDNDGQNAGYDLPLLLSIKAAVKVPVIASSGAGAPEHFSKVFERTNVEPNPKPDPGPHPSPSPDPQP